MTPLERITERVTRNGHPEDLRPDDIWEGFLENVRYEPYAVPAGTRAVACWWD